jgi:hypothetical protein
MNENAAFGSTTENAPPGRRGAFWGYYREERYVCISIYVDPWEVGGP